MATRPRHPSLEGASRSAYRADVRLPGTPHECGPLFELGWISRQLALGAPIHEGTDTIPVAQIIGSAQRARDFDLCWHPLHPRLTKQLDDIQAAQPAGLDEPIDVVRVDRAYFVRDGHKRVALACRTGREFIDAEVSRVSTDFALTADLDEQAILRTARESEFRRHSGFHDALPEVRFALTDIDGYGELYGAVRAHAFEMAERNDGRLMPWPDVARDWYATDYLPTIEASRTTIGGLLDDCSDADIFLAIHRRRLAWWGSECDAVDCAAQQLLAERRIEEARRRSLLAGMLGRRAAGTPTPTLLPLTDDS
jgi:hypothetical protein